MARRIVSCCPESRILPAPLRASLLNENSVQDFGTDARASNGAGTTPQRPRPPGRQELLPARGRLAPEAQPLSRGCTSKTRPRRYQNERRRRYQNERVQQRGDKARTGRAPSPGPTPARERVGRGAALQIRRMTTGAAKASAKAGADDIRQHPSGTHGAQGGGRRRGAGALPSAPVLWRSWHEDDSDRAQGYSPGDGRGIPTAVRREARTGDPCPTAVGLEPGGRLRTPSPPPPDDAAASAVRQWSQDRGRSPTPYGPTAADRLQLI